MRLPVYMDNHATTPVDPRVLERMLPYLQGEFGNAASKTHAYGWRAEAAVDQARAQIAELIGCSPSELIFTSGATESNNLAIKGAADFFQSQKDHIVTVKTEHRAVLDVCRRLERGQSIRVTYLDVDPDGRVSSDAVREAITDRTILVSVMLANNEIGTLQPVAEIGKICRERGVLFHCDAVQGIGKVPFGVEAASVDLASLSAHKIYGPKGVGALYVRKKPRVRLLPLIDGGGHERGLRSGTLNVPGIVGFGAAAELIRDAMPQESERILGMREKLRRHLFKHLDGVRLNGSLEHRLPGNLNVSFVGVDGTGLLRALKDVAVSSGSACTSASIEPSYVLRACGVEEALAQSSIRFGMGRFNTDEEIDFVAKLVVDQVPRLREQYLPSPPVRRE